MSNLIDNAIKYGDKEPEIKKIRTKANNKRVILCVTDKGIGMTKEESQKIFDKFYRVSKRNVHDVKGFGLGLSYVLTMTNAHNGNVKVKKSEE